MTSRQFDAWMQAPCPMQLLAVGRDEAQQRLATAERFAKRAEIAAPAVRGLAALELNRATVLAQEWYIAPASECHS